MDDDVINDPDVPGLARPTTAVVNDMTVFLRGGVGWKFELLEGGGLFVSQWRGDNMVGHVLFDKDVTAQLKKLLK